jgi:hypothetical protein
MVGNNFKLLEMLLSRENLKKKKKKWRLLFDVCFFNSISRCLHWAVFERRALYRSRPLRLCLRIHRTTLRGWYVNKKKRKITKFILNPWIIYPPPPLILSLFIFRILK